MQILPNRSKIQYVAGGLLLITAALLFWLTLDNGLRPDELMGGDLITHQYAQLEARPSNAPGYPLYTMGGWLWFRLGRWLLSWALNPIQILSLYSTLWGLASLLVLYLILLGVTRGHWPIACLLTAFFAVTFFFWYYTVTTEQYTSAVFQTLLLIWLAFRWDDLPRDSTLLWLAFISGTMLANMVTTLFILPPLLWFIFSKPAERGPMLFHYLKRPALVLRAVGAALLPLLSYTYIYIRGAQHPEWRGLGQWPSTWGWFVQFITIQQGRDELTPGLSLQTIFTAEFPALMWQELTWIVFLGGLLGLACLGRRRAIFLYSTLLIYFVFCWGYRFGNWFQVIIPAYPIFIIGFAAGLRRVSEWAKLQRPTNLKPETLLILFLAGLLIYRFATNLPRANQRNLSADTGLNPGWAILADSPAPPGLIVATFEERVALQYLRAAWGLIPGLTPVDIHDLPPANSVSNLYLTRQAAQANPTLTQRLRPQAVGQQVIALKTAPITNLPPTANPTQLDFGDSLHLVGWEQIQADSQSPANWQIALYWQALAPLNDDYTISVRPLLAGQLLTNGQETLIQDHQPVWGVYPTSRWTPGEIVRDVYALPLPALPDAAQIVVYKAAGSGFENIGQQTITLATGH